MENTPRTTGDRCIEATLERVEMEKYHEMMARLLVAGMQADNLPVGFMGGPRMKTLKGVRMKCTKATLLARMDGEELIDFENKLPYGFLHVEAPELRECTIVAVRHKLDFWNAWVLNERGVFEDDDCEVHLVHKKAGGIKRLFAGILPYFEYMVFSAGLFDDLCNPNVREFALEEKPLLRLYGHDREVNE
jgi:hypothetical protein